MNITIKEPVAVVEADLKHMIELISYASDVAEQLNVMCKVIEEKADMYLFISLQSMQVFVNVRTIVNFVL